MDVSRVDTAAYIDGFNDGYNQCELDWQWKLNEYGWNSLNKKSCKMPDQGDKVLVCLRHKITNKKEYVIAYTDYDDDYGDTWFVDETDECFEDAYFMSRWDVIGWKQIDPYEDVSEDIAF